MKQIKNRVRVEAVNGTFALFSALSHILFVEVVEMTLHNAPFTGNMTLYRQEDGSFSAVSPAGQQFVYLFNPFGTLDTLVATDEDRAHVVATVVPVLSDAIRANPELVKKESF